MGEYYNCVWDDDVDNADVAVAFPNILKLIEHPNQGGMLRAWVYHEACRPLNQKKCLSSVLFSLKTAF